MKGSPTVSVIICVYNGERYLRESIESALAQSYPSVEVIIINDGSTDNSESICRSYEGRVTCLSQRNQGLAQARNRGIGESKGAYIALLDQDDLWRPDKLEKQMKLFVQNPELGLAYSNYLQIDPEGRVIEKKSSEERRMRRGRVVSDLYDHNFIGNATVVVPKEVLDQVGPFSKDLAYSLDWDLWLRIAFKYPVDFVDEPLASWRWRPNYAEENHEITLREAYKIVLARQPELSSKLTGAQNDGVQTRLARISFSLGQLYRRKGTIAESMEWIRRSMDHGIFIEDQRRVFEEIASGRR